MPTINNTTTANSLIAKKRQPLPLPSRAPQQPQRVVLQPPLPSRVPQAQPPSEQAQAPPSPPLLLHLQDVSQDDRAQLRTDMCVLADVERQIALLHAPPPGNNNHPSIERRRDLVGHAVLTALPLMAKVAGLARATKTYHEDALPSDLVACRDRLDALGLHTTGAYAYMKDLVECQTLGDAILRAAGTPLRPL
jgi:hypothetical protein